MMTRFLRLCLLVLAIFASANSVEAKVRHYKWDVKYEFKSPDCYKKLAITINGKSPGPTIVAQQGDTVVVEVKNSLLTENLAIHWHGIRQEARRSLPTAHSRVASPLNLRHSNHPTFSTASSTIGTPWADGTEGVTQCPVVAGDTHVYKFVVDRPGTYLYHAHYGMQRQAGLQGMIRVYAADSEPFEYDYDRSILLTDWYHKSTYEQATGLALPAPNFTWVGEPQSLLIHGRGKFNCSSASSEAVCEATNPQCSPYSMTVVPGKVYRLRIGSLTALSALSFEIEGHNMTVVEADGHYVDPFIVKNLFIYSGETYSVLIKADQDPSRNYWISSKIVSRPSNTSNGLGIFNYYPNHPRRNPPTTPPAGPRWNDTAPRVEQSKAVKAHPRFVHAPPRTSDRVIVMLNTQNEINGVRRWSVNNVSFNLPHTPYLIALKHKLLHAFDQTPPPEDYDHQTYDIFSVQNNSNAVASNAIYRLKFNSTVDIILQNANTMNPSNSETHPWHLHGHDFWVLGYGSGKFNRSSDPQNYNLENPIMKNTVPVHPYGWTALRFRADNPGVWAFHCHIESHFFMGMGVVFEEGIEKVGILPSSIMGCGDSKGFGRP